MDVRWITGFVDRPAETFDACEAFWLAVHDATLSPRRGDADQFATLVPPDGDAFLRIQGEPVVVDWKTTKSIYPEVGLQLAAYRFADHVIDQYGTQSPIPALNGGAVLHVREDGYDLVPLRCDEQVFEIFLGLRNFSFEWATDMSKTIVGAPLRPAVNA